MTRKNRFRKLQREQNSTNETTNASKLDETRRRRRTNKTRLHGSYTNPSPHCIPYLNLVTKRKDKDVHKSVDPGGLAVPLGTSTAAGKQYKAQEVLLASLGTGSSPFICFGAKTSNNSEQGPSGPPLKVKA